jgi:hypothetical protein
MTQLIFGKKSSLGWVGKAYTDDDIKVDSKLAVGNIEFGSRLSFTDANKEKVSMMGTNKIKLTLSADLSASNVFAFTLKSYNTTTKLETSTSVTATYATSHNATMGSIVTQCEANVGVNASGTLSSGNVLTIVANDGYILEVSSEAVTSGSAVTVIKENLDSRLPAGFAMFCDKEMFEENGVFVSRYKDGDIVDHFRCGTIIVDSTTGFNGTDSLYVLGYGTNRGKIANASGNNGILLTDMKHYKTASASSRGVVNISLI